MWNWNTVDFEFAGPHTIASDGDIYVVDNTGCHEVIVIDSNFKFKQRFSGISYRPHHTEYDPLTQAFYVVTGQNIFCFKKNNGNLFLDHQW